MASAMLEPALESDISAIVDLVNRAFRETGAQESWNVEDFIEGPRIDEAAVRDDVEEELVHLLVHRDPEDGRLISTVRLEPAGGGIWHLGMLSVSPDRQAGQLGRRMVEAAEDYMREQDGRRVLLSVVNRRETLIDWYVRRGYRLTGERMPFPYDDQRFGRPLRDDLEFVMLEKTL